MENERGVRRCLRLAGAEKELGFVSSFNFVPQRYPLSQSIREKLETMGFEVGVHDLRHDGTLYRSREFFAMRACIINQFLEDWNAVGFRSASMFHKLEWIHDLHIEYDSSTFDTDPFEPQPDGMATIFPMWIAGKSPGRGYVELPYTLPQDLTLFILLRQGDQHIWKEKLAWVAQKGGMALLNAHPDYMYWGGEKRAVDEYYYDRYTDFLHYVNGTYRNQYWQALPREVARFWKNSFASCKRDHDTVLPSDVPTQQS